MRGPHGSTTSISVQEMVFCESHSSMPRMQGSQVHAVMQGDGADVVRGLLIVQSQCRNTCM